MTKLIFVRHGHVEGIEPERFRGRLDLPLTDLGQAQARSTNRSVLTGGSRSFHAVSAELTSAALQ